MQKQLYKLRVPTSKNAPLLTSCVPNLSFYDFIIDCYTPSRELHSDGGFGLQAELVPSKSRQQVGLTHTRVPNEYHLEEVIVVIVCSVSHFVTSKLPYNFKVCPSEKDSLPTDHFSTAAN